MLGFDGMGCRINWHGRTNLDALPDHHLAHIEDYAVEIQDDAPAQLDVVAIVAVEGCAQVEIFSHRYQMLSQQRGAFVGMALVVESQPELILEEIGLQVRVVGRAELAVQQDLDTLQDLPLVQQIRTLARLLPNGNYQFGALVVSMQGREPGGHRTHRPIQISPDAQLIYER